MKKIFLFCLLAMAATLLHAQAPSTNSFVKGQKDLNLGLGLGSSFYHRASSSIPTIGLSFDYGITDEISLGAYLGYAGATYKYYGTTACGNILYSYEDVYKWSFMIIGARAAYHFAKIIPNDNIDLYAGLMLGDNYAKYNYSSNSPCKNNSIYGSGYGGFIFSGFAGIRYRFDPHFGAFAELGYGISYLTIGLNYKL